MSINNLVVSGNISNVGEYKQVGDDKKTKINFSIAVTNKARKDNNVMFLNCSAWNKVADFVYKFVHKGDRVVLRGSIDKNVYQNKEYIFVNCEDIDLIYSKEEKSNNKPSDKVELIEEDQAELPF